VDTQALGKIIIIAGVTLVILGLALTFGRGNPVFGRLPGDIRIERPNFKLYIPLTSCILLSLLLSAIAYVISRFR
jgi:hypothetical protein